MTNTYMQKYSVCLTIKEVQIKTSKRNHLIPVKKAITKKKVTTAVKDVNKRELRYTAGGSIN